MITKITIQLPPALAYHTEARSANLQMAANDAIKIGERLTLIGNLIKFLNQFPHEPIERSINNIIPNAQIFIKEYTKKRRNYSIQYLTIWEEDVVNNA